MPFFKKSSSGCIGSSVVLLSEAKRRVLRRCRLLLIKDIDAVQITELMVQLNYESLKADQRDAISLNSTREQRAAVLLDQLELRDDETFNVFMEALKSCHRHLHSLLEEMLHNSANDESNVERVAVSGSELRKLLLQRFRRDSDGDVKPTTTATKTLTPDRLSDSESFNEGRNCCYSEVKDYIKCFTLTMRSHLPPEKWICHDDIAVVSREDSLLPDDGMEMVELLCDLLFKKPDKPIPKSVRQPPLLRKVFVVERNVSMKDLLSQPQSIKEPMSSRSGPRIVKDKPVGQTPPPVPPKPRNLPTIGLLNRSTVLNDTVQQDSSDKGDQHLGSFENRQVQLQQKTLPAVVDSGRSVDPPSQTVSSSSIGVDNIVNAVSSDARSVTESLPQKNGQDVDEDDVDRPSLNFSVSVCSINSEAVDFDDDPSNATDATTTCESRVKPQLQSLYSVVDKKRNRNKSTISTSTTASSVGSNAAPAVAASDAQTAPSPTESAVCDDDNKRNLCDSADLMTSDGAGGNVTVLCESVDEMLNVSSPTAAAATAAAEGGGARQKTHLSLKRSSSYGDLPCQSQLTNEQLKLNVSDIIVTAEQDDESSNGDSYYEDIDVLSSSHRSGRRHSSRNARINSRVAMQSQEALLQTRGYCLLNCNSLLIAEMKEACEMQAAHECDEEDLLPFIGTTLAFDRNGNAFYIPKGQLKRYGDPSNEPWFFPLPLTPRQATLFLGAERLEGCFVVYRCQTPPPPPAGGGANDSGVVVYTLSVCHSSGDVLHYNIVQHAHGDLSIAGHSHSFLTLGELVRYFQLNKSSLATRLRRPLSQAKLAVSPGVHYDKRFEIDRSHVSLTGRIIGKGQFGVICAGIYECRAVAVKVLHKADLNLSDEDEFIEEAKCLMRLQHPHVVQLFGVVGASRPMFIVTELMAHGNLKEALQNGTIHTDNLETLFDICLQVVSAMQYLESVHYMLHRDVSARNFLLTDTFNVKLGHFGRARFVCDDSYRAQRSEKICVKWSPPEVLLESAYSTRSDVWATGVVLWEIFSRGERPYKMLSGEETAVYVVEGGRLDKPANCPRDLFNIITSCWHQDPCDRPSFAQLWHKLHSKSSIYYEPIPIPGAVVVRHEFPQANRTPSHLINTTSPIRKKFKMQAVAAHYNQSATTRARKMRKSVTTAGDQFRGSAFDFFDEMDRRIPVTSSSETSLTSLPGSSLDDLGRGDKIRKSLRKLMNMKVRAVSTTKPQKALKLI